MMTIYFFCCFYSLPSDPYDKSHFSSYLSHSLHKLKSTDVSRRVAVLFHNMTE